MFSGKYPAHFLKGISISPVTQSGFVYKLLELCPITTTNIQNTAPGSRLQGADK